MSNTFRDWDKIVGLKTQLKVNSNWVFECLCWMWPAKFRNQLIDRCSEIRTKNVIVCASIQFLVGSTIHSCSKHTTVQSFMCYKVDSSHINQRRFWPYNFSSATNFKSKRSKKNSRIGCYSLVSDLNILTNREKNGFWPKNFKKILQSIWILFSFFFACYIRLDSIERNSNKHGNTQFESKSKASMRKWKWFRCIT